MIHELESARRATLDALVEHLAEEHMSVEEFERRVQIVKDAAAPGAVNAALAGLPGRGAGAART